MKKTVRVLWTAAALLGLSAGSQAYEFAVPACKAVQNWVPIYGQCDAAGVLTGSGAALYYNLLTRGQFKDGLPEGKHEFFLGSSGGFQQQLKTMATSEITDWWTFVTRNPAVAKLTESAEAPGTCRQKGNSERLCSVLDGRTSFCSISFKAGVVEAKEIACALARPDYSESMSQSARYVIVPFDGKVRLETRQTRKAMAREQQVTLVADVPEMSLLSNYGTILFGRRSISLKGVADSVEYSASGISVKGMLGDYSANAGTKDEILINGYLNAECSGDGRCKVAEKEFQPQGGPVDIRYLSSRTLGGKKYQYVMQSLPKGAMFSNGKTGLGYIYYFKAPDGFEFDGSAGSCPGGGRAVLVESSASLDVIPICGKVTSPKGQSFTGKFDSEGRPVVP